MTTQKFCAISFEPASGEDWGPYYFSTADIKLRANGYEENINMGAISSRANEICLSPGNVTGNIYLVISEAFVRSAFGSIPSNMEVEFVAHEANSTHKSKPATVTVYSGAWFNFTHDTKCTASQVVSAVANATEYNDASAYTGTFYGTFDAAPYVYVKSFTMETVLYTLKVQYEPSGATVRVVNSKGEQM